MTEDGTSPESPRASTGCCGCIGIGGHWLGKRPATLKSGNAAEAEARQHWETVSPGFALVVPPSSPVSLESSAVQSSVPTPTHRSTSPLDDENLDLGFFTREHKASFVDNGGGISSTLSTQAVTPPSSSPSHAAPSGTADAFWSSLGESSDDIQTTQDFAPLFHSEVWPAKLQEQEPAVSKPPGTPSQTPPGSTPYELGGRDDRLSSVPRLASPAQFLRDKIKREEIEGAEARAKAVEAASAEPRVIVPLLATPDQFRLHKVRQKELEESLKAKQDEDATVEAETRHRVPTLPSPEEVLSQKDRQQAWQMEAVRAARMKEPKVVIPKLHPPGRSSQEEEADSVDFDPGRPKVSQEREGREDSGAWNGEHDDEAGKSPRYVELVSRIEQLALDLETAKSRGQKSKLLLEWSQLRANSLEEGVAGLSEELTQQQSAYLDLQAKHLAHIGINLPAPSTSSTDDTPA